MHGDDEEYCPFTIQIINLGVNHNSSVSSFDKLGFSHLYCMAPEIIKNNESSLYYTDVWACGIIMYLLFAGTHPFKAQNNFDFCN